MAAKFTISGSESDSSDEVKEEENNPSLSVEGQHVPQRHTLTLPELRSGTGRLRLNSESHAYTVSKDEDLQARGEAEAGTPTEGSLLFRGRSKSAPPVLWAAKKYGRQLRRMSDEFDSLLDKGEMKKVRNAGPAKPMHHSKSWWSYLFSHQEMEGENNHLENHTSRTE